jgi:hypothetical protein
MLNRREFMLILGSTAAALAGADSFAATPHVHRVAALGTMRKAYTRPTATSSATRCCG